MPSAPETHHRASLGLEDQIGGRSLDKSTLESRDERRDRERQHQRMGAETRSASLLPLESSRQRLDEIAPLAPSTKSQTRRGKSICPVRSPYREPGRTWAMGLLLPAKRVVEPKPGEARSRQPICGAAALETSSAAAPARGPSMPSLR